MVYSSLKSTVIQVAVSLVANWGMMNTGMVLGFPSAVVPPLLGSGPGLHASISEASWAASLSLISASVTSLLAGPLIDGAGRRWGLQLMNIAYALGWLLMAVLPESMLALYIGRLLSGAGMGLATCAAASYTAEVASVALRTTLVALTPVMMATGTLLVYLGALLYQNSWTELSYVGFGLNLLSFVMTFLLPESPLWLLNKGRAGEAEVALMRLRGASITKQVKEELDSISSRARHMQQTDSCLSILHNLRQPEAYKPLILMNIFFVFNQLCGIPILMAYAVSFTQNAGLKAEAYYLSLGISGIRLLSSLLNSWACNKYGKRGPAVFTGIVMTVSMTTLAFSVSAFLTLPPLLVGVIILIFVLSSCMGFSALPWSMLGEVFPTNVRGIASGITACHVYLESFILMKLYPELVLSLGAFVVFLFFAISGLIGTLFVLFFLPETHGKTLLEIEDSFKVTRKSMSTRSDL